MCVGFTKEVGEQVTKLGYVKWESFPGYFVVNDDYKGVSGG